MSDGVYPMNQASLQSFVVPVLPAAGSVNPALRARAPVPALMTSDNIVDIRNAVVGLIARVDDSSVANSTRPSRSSTLRMVNGFGTSPWLANAAYAAVIDWRV